MFIIIYYYVFLRAWSVYEHANFFYCLLDLSCELISYLLLSIQAKITYVRENAVIFHTNTLCPTHPVI